MLYFMKTKHRAEFIESESISVTIIEYWTGQFIYKSIEIAFLEDGGRDMVEAADKGLHSISSYA